jgi:hypothetical protein
VRLPPLALDAITIEQFVRTRYSTPAVQKLVASWRIEPEAINRMVIDQFREMGIFSVPYGHDKLMLNHMLAILRHSPEIASAIKRSEIEDQRRMRTRHSG